MPNPKNPKSFIFGITSRFLIYSAAIFLPLALAVLMGVVLAILPGRSVEDFKQIVVPGLGTLIVIFLFVAEILRSVAYDADLPHAAGKREIHFPPDALPKAHLGPHPSEPFASSANTLANSLAKRMFDVTISVAAIAFLAPLLGLVAVSLRAAGHSKSIVSLPKRGLNGEKFQVYAFNANPADPGPLDYFLIATSISILPAFWSVVKGDMSIVGPPPLSDSQVRSNFELPVKPGLLWFSGFDSMELLEDYVAGWSLGRDLSLLARTIPEGFFGETVSSWNGRRD